MDAKDLEGREWIGVFGAAVIVALVTALALPSAAQGQPAPVVIESSATS
jgi:hypothetical protein